MTIPSKFRRRSIRLSGYDYANAGAYFVTICATDYRGDARFDRRRGDACVALNTTYVFGHITDGRMVLNAQGRIAAECLRAIPEHFPSVTMDEFTVMPNHVHFIVVIATHASPVQLGVIVGSYKSAVTKRVNELCGTSGAKLWQRNYYEHIIRNDAELQRIRAYVIENPLNWATDENNRM